MGLKHLLPYLVGLVLLAFALASLSRSTAGGSILFRSYWLLYIIYLAPVLLLAIMVGIIALLALNWRDIASGIGFKMAQNRKARKKRSRYSFFVTLFMWALAVVILIERPGTIFNHASSNSTSAPVYVNGVATNSTLAQFSDAFPTISNLVQSNWFAAAILGLLAVGGLVLVQSVRVGMKETSEMNIEELQMRRVQGLQAAQEAIKIVDEAPLDPRGRIINCFQRLVMTVSRLGAPVSPDLTARELENAIRSTFALEGNATTRLTELFEEARYSRHEISGEKAAEARQCLEQIAEELKVQLDK